MATPQLQSLAGNITLLPFTLFGGSLLIGAFGCVFAYRTTDKNIRIETYADELRTRLEQVGQLEQQNNLLNQFAAMAAHDLQAPFRFIVSNAHLMISDLEELNEPELLQMATTLVEQGMRMRALVLDLLEFCRAGQGQLTTTPVDMHELISEEVRLLKAHEEYAGTQITIGSLPNVLICDADKVAHIVRNLLGNAVKFSQESSAPQVSISASRDTQHGPWTFRIQDNGPGVSEEHHDVIFRPFTRLDAKTKGTGMGLAIVKIMLERHGGTIFIEPSDTKGSTFCFTMPGSMPESKTI
jgi:chemotaxis family two-component system sensor kinase Cph1